VIPALMLVQQMNDLVKTGKIRYWGVANWPVEKIQEVGSI
jgi:diketogulonate reductase-like aldo/keto reductase